MINEKSKVKKGYKNRQKAVNISLYVLLSVMVIVWILPIIWLIINSFRETPALAFPQVNFKDIEGEGIVYYLNGLKAILLPTKWSFQNYINLFTRTEIFDFPRWFMNTLFVATCSCVISTLIVLATSFAFSRLRFKMRKPYMNIILVLGLFPGFLTMIAIYYILKMIGLSQSLFALILVYSGGASMGYYICKGFFDTIPTAIDESAYLDGATKSQIFFKMTLPLSKPILATITLFSAVGYWNEWFSAVLYLNDSSKYPVTLYLRNIMMGAQIGSSGEKVDLSATVSIPQSVQATAMLLVILPILCVYPFVQKHFAKGVMIGSIKG